MSTPSTSQNRDSDRVAEIRQRLEAARGRWVVTHTDVHWTAAELVRHAPDDLVWLLSRLAVVEAERDEPRAKVAAVEAPARSGLTAGDLVMSRVNPASRGTVIAVHRVDGTVSVQWDGYDRSERWHASALIRRALSGTTEGPS